MAGSQGIPFVGRERECSLLDTALGQVAGRKGSMWVLSGPAGIGKTRLLRWLEEDAQGKGFDIHWAYCLKETNSAYFPFYPTFDNELTPTPWALTVYS